VRATVLKAHSLVHTTSARARVSRGRLREPNALSRVGWLDGDAFKPPSPPLSRQKPRRKSGLFLYRESESTEIEMDAKRLHRSPPGKIIITGWVTAIVACFALGQAQAQFVNPVPPPPPPTFNPSSPSTVPQAPETPVSPGTPSGLPGSSGVPAGLNENPPAIASPTSRNGTAASVETTPSVSRAHGSHHGHLAQRRHARHYAAPVIGPSYYPGLGIVYPPYADPCHWGRTWEGPWVGSRVYSCS
jgi:hypothetical protein